MFTLNNTIPKYIPIGDFYTPILKEVVRENDKIERVPSMSDQRRLHAPEYTNSRQIH